ncbi:SGNH/GDSL hydrolase family protein [Arthrobacter sp. STN4]|uniref:SGNH/GDSL hydrolase family protein n=1 Tax=Arthrobacter sp. STN4 TaxID=2923276 RepID=UPI00211A3648|nr:SGNH/GDSL hydrolase family protein [Arthrobacter sp. STN4]MCQ9163399.1 SGNH/GDSL hydrolase family protein [Arthrobacter sp. STN4]
MDRRRWVRWGVLPWLALAAILALAGCEGVADPGNAAAANPAATASRPHKVVVVGDSFSTGYGSSAEDAWPSLISAAPLDPDDNFDVVNVSHNGSGYVTVGDNNSTFGAQVQQAVTADTQLVVFFGSENDMGHSKAGIAAAASAAYAAVKAKSPHAVELVVGPPTYTSAPEAARLDVRDALEQAASDSGALFVDPIQQGWFIGKVAELVGPDGDHPTAAGQRYLQAQLEKLIKEAVETLPAPTVKAR